MEFHIDNPKAFLRAYAALAGLARGADTNPTDRVICVSASNGVASLAIWRKADRLFASAILPGSTGEDGRILVPRDKFLQVLNAQAKLKGGWLRLKYLPERVGKKGKDKITLPIALEVSGEGVCFEMTWEDPDAFPAAIDAGEAPGLGMTAGAFCRMVAVTVPFADPNSTRYALHSIVLEASKPPGREVGERFVNCVATDGRRLSRFTFTANVIDGHLGEFDTPRYEKNRGALIPVGLARIAASFVSKLYEPDDLVTVSFPEDARGRNICRVDCRSVNLVERPPASLEFSLGEGRFPDYSQVYPPQANLVGHLTFEKASELLATVKHAAAICKREENRSIDFAIDREGHDLVLHYVGREDGAAAVRHCGAVEMSFADDVQASLCFMPEYLIDGVSAFDEDAPVRLEVYGKTDPILLKGSGLEHIIMPLSISNFEQLKAMRLTLPRAMAMA